MAQASTDRLLQLLRTGPKTDGQLSRRGVPCYTAAVITARSQGAEILRTRDLFHRSAWTFTLLSEGARS
jgi:hypothetical protein